MSCGLVQDRLLSIKGKRCMEHVANMREKPVLVLLGKSEGKRLSVSPRRRWEDNNKVVLQVVVSGTWNEIVSFRTGTSVVCF